MLFEIAQILQMISIVLSAPTYNTRIASVLPKSYFILHLSIIMLFLLFL
jgi:hypothetical protein